MAEIGRRMEEYVREFTEKVKKGVLPPDPLRTLEFVLRTWPSIEHALALPPLVEKLHSEVVEPMIEKAPRLPLTGDYPIIKWKEYRTE